jgi:hypothetical protein
MAIALSTFQTMLAPLQGLWQWLVTPIEGQGCAPAPVARSAGRLAPGGAGRPVSVRSSLPVRRIVRPVRVVRVLEAAPGQPAASRIVISGRMADVCAELDRLAAQESRSAG